jgi:hypothetical protein
VTWTQVLASSAIFGVVMLATFGLGLLLIRMPLLLVKFPLARVTLSEHSAKKAKRIVGWLCFVLWSLYVLNMTLFHLGL